MKKFLKKVSLALVVGALCTTSTLAAAQDEPDDFAECKQRCVENRYNLVNMVTGIYTDEMLRGCLQLCEWKYL